MTANHTERPAEIFDMIGVGFGPANLALAIALDESEVERSRYRFLELQESFSWHQGMLIEGATMQVSFLKDLVTMRNPTSSLSFLSYLSARGRLVDFINSKTFYPLRVEFNDYLSWAAEQYADRVDYGAQVTEIRPVSGGDGVELLEVDYHETSTTAIQTMRARNVVIAAGITPRLPSGIQLSERIWHTAQLIQQADRLAASQPRTFVVLGAGQSAAEAADYLHQRFDSAEIYAVHSRFGYSAADDSPFVNQIFNPEAVDQFFAAPEDVKQSLLSYHMNTNYSVVDADLINTLYQRVYLESLTGRKRLHFFNTSRVRSADSRQDGVSVVVESLVTGGQRPIEADALICATGYVPGDVAGLLPGLLAHCKRDDGGRLLLNRDHSVMTDPDVRCGIYLQGNSEHTHGIASTLLSLVAVRAGEIAKSLKARSSSLSAGGASTLCANSYGRQNSHVCSWTLPSRRRWSPPGRCTPVPSGHTDISGGSRTARHSCPGRHSKNHGSPLALGGNQAPRAHESG